MTHMEDLKTSNIEDADEGRAFSLASVQTFVDSSDKPFEKPFVHRFGESFHGEFNLRKSISRLIK